VTPYGPGRRLLLALGQAGVVLLILVIALDGSTRDFHVPLYFSYDALEYLMQVKGTIENGWWWVHPRLSAPGAFEQVLYPSNTTVDQTIVWIVSRFTGEPGLVINVSWMIMVALASWIASVCLGTLGLERRLSVVLGVLYALSPYTLSRHVDHFSLATYLVPLPATVALLLATGRLRQLTASTRWALAGGCALVGFNYPYYAFFGCFLLLVGTVIVFAAERHQRHVADGLSYVAVIGVATAINLTPSLYAWSEHGRPISVPEKRAAEAEQYGLKIRHLVSPVTGHSFPPLRAWTNLEDEANYPLENENRNARLGFLGAVGFLALLSGLFAPAAVSGAANGCLFTGASRLTLAAVLLGTVGGLGSLFNLLVTADIRAYNRLTPFIAFYSLLAIGLLGSRLLARSNGVWAPLGLGMLAAVGLYDQVQAAQSLNREYPAIRDEWQEASTFVRSLEQRVEPGTMVFQLPVVVFQNESTGRERMLPNDHLKLYVPSTRIHWSYPALSDRFVRWQQQLGRLPPAALASALASEGFAAIVIDRHGYADGGASLLAAFSASSSRHRPHGGVIAESDRYVAVSLESIEKRAGAVESPKRNAVVQPATAGVPQCSGGTAHAVEWIDHDAPPFDQPVSFSKSGDLLVLGWAVDSPQRQLAGDVDLAIGRRLFPALYGFDRADVAAYLGSSIYQPSGFAARVNGTHLIDAGAGTLSIRILSADRRCYYEGPSVSLVAR
jgi:phosphoglycerol transferase